MPADKAAAGLGGSRRANLQKAAGRAGLTLNDKTPPKTTSGGGGALQLIQLLTLTNIVNLVAARSLTKSPCQIVRFQYEF